MSDWHGCYRDSWKGAGMLVDEAYAHPAKFAYGLVLRIIRHGLEQEYWKPGDLIGDPFAGVACGGLVAAYHGLRWFGVELEQRFVDLGNQNIAKHRPRWKVSGDPCPVLIQGDSRGFAMQCDAIVTSPPFGNENTPGGDSPARAGISEDGKPRGGRTPHGSGQCDAIVTSPPYAESVNQSASANDAEARIQRKATAGVDVAKSANVGGPNSVLRQSQAYGTTPGQIGALKAGKLDAVVTSPPHAEGLGHGGQPTRGGERGEDRNLDGMQEGYGVSDGQIGSLPAGKLDGIVTSPPFRDARSDTTRPRPPESMDGELADKDGRIHRLGACDCGDAEGQIDKLPTGSLDGIVTSPPYAESVQGQHGETETAEETRAKRKTQGGSLGKSERYGGYGVTEGNIGNLKEGQLDAVVTSPPWAEQTAYQIYDQTKGFHSYDENESKNRMKRDYVRGDTPGQIGALKAGDVDSCLQQSSESGKMVADTQDIPDNETVSLDGPSADSPRLGVQPSGLASFGDKTDEDELGMDRRVLRGRRMRDVVRGEKEGDGGSGCSCHNRPERKSAPGTDPAFLEQTGLPSVAPVSTESIRAKPESVLDSTVHPQSGGESVSSQDHSLSCGKAAKGQDDIGEAAGTAPGTPGKNRRRDDSPADATKRTSRSDSSRDGNRDQSGVRSSETRSETYWEACAEVYQQCRRALRPNGLLVVIVKDYVSKGKRVPLCDNTAKLLTSLGFDVFEQTKAWLVERDEQPGLFGEPIVKTKERKSFFRRLAEKKGSPAIDYEVVLWARSPD